MTIRILLADDHTIVRDGLRALLETQPGFQVVAGVSNGREAVQAACQLKPDVVVMDIAMPELNGLEAAGQIQRACPHIKIIILSIHATSEHIYQALRAGAMGYLLKESAGNELVEAVRTVAAGKRYLAQRISDTVLEEYLRQRAEAHQPSPLESLSAREREVLQLVAEGLSSAQIAERLSLSPRTVETYRARLMNKLNLRDLPAVIRFAIEHGLTAPK